ncbi:MAG: hypothetical protein GX575_26250 [Candidatus Anammoximicrobium sp.]|nr:hypothetical protein [Candidatus Anammoximicrobium sp.]
MRTCFWQIAGMIVGLSCFVAGCGGDSFDRVPLAGTVTCDGMESINGGILATPAQEGTGAPKVSGPITDGKFSIPAAQGPVAGSYIFEISLQIPGMQPKPGSSPEGERETGPTITYRKSIDVPAGGSSSLTIALTAADKVGDSEARASAEP